MAKSTAGKAKKANAQAKAAMSGPRAATKTMRGLSLHIGLNSVNPKHYAGWSGDLMACEFDAEDMAALATVQGIKPTVLLTTKATRGNVLKAVRAAAKLLTSGDLFFVSYSGHGGQIHDSSGDEPDAKDETWCLFDGELIDDELFNEMANFREGVRVIVLSDSCHSGSVVRARVPETIAGDRPVEDDAALGGDAHLHAEPEVLRHAAGECAEGREAKSPQCRSRRRARAAAHERQRAAHRDRWNRQSQRDSDLRLPGQPDVARRRPQRRLHRAAAADLG